MPFVNYPPLIQWRRDVCNITADGHPMYPSAKFLSNCVAAENHLAAHRHREVFSCDWRLADASSGISATTTIRRFRFRAGAGATRLRAFVLLGTTYNGFTPPTDPYLTIDVTASGGGTTTMGPWHYGIKSSTWTDEPNSWHPGLNTIDIVPGAVYECAVITHDYCRPLGISVYEIGSPTVTESVQYFNRSSPQAGAPIYDADRSRLLVGVDAMLRANGGTAFHWGMRDGTARTRTSATPINLIDNTTTGAPTAATPGFHLDMTYRNTASRSTVPMQIGVFASVAGGGTGHVTVRNSSGVIGNCAIVSAVGAWVTESTCPVTAGADKYDLQFFGDGVNVTTVNAVSVIEWEG